MVEFHLTKHYIHIMFRILKDIVLSTKSSDIWLKILILLLLVYLVLRYKKNIMFNQYEGFEQSTNYVVMRENNIYDDFYASIYNDLYHGKYDKNIIDNVCKNTQAGKSSKALVLGSSTGTSLDYLKENGLVYVKGIDKSQSMVNKCISSREIQNEDIENTMAYDKNEFSHVFCLGSTIYENKEKEKIINNCHLWLGYGGYFIISLIDVNTYSFIPDIALDEIISPLNHSKENYSDNLEQTSLWGAISNLHWNKKASESHLMNRIDQTNIDFDDFEYKCSMNYNNVSSGCGVCERKETFTDKKTGHVRENIQSLFLESREKMVNMIKKCGFDEKGYMDNKYGLYTYIFVKSSM